MLENDAFRNATKRKVNETLFRTHAECLRHLTISESLFSLKPFRVLPTILKKLRQLQIAYLFHEFKPLHSIITP